MHIILGKDNLPNIEDRYTLLEVDLFTVHPDGDPVQAYCIVDNLHLEDLFHLDINIALHQKLIEHYRKRDWSLCNQLLEQLETSWNGQLKSFYDDLSLRIDKYKEEDPGEDWDYSIHKY